METTSRCPECGAVWQDGLTCQDHFHHMLAWEAEYPDKTLAVHHLLVLCYHLQHPHLYSPEGLQGAKKILFAFVEEGVTPQEMRRRQRAVVDSGKRTWKITGTPTSYGAYAHPIQWPITVVDVAAGGVEDYLGNAQAWARSICEALKKCP
ncbi:MAG TPA: DUF5946 family protein [Ktedonobacterales bacterium]|jgi:hypothetical protein